MKLAILSDIHANLEALNAIFKDIESHQAEKICFLGDAVGYGANPNKCVKLLAKYCDIKLLGNHDYVALGLDSAKAFNPLAKESILWTQEKLKRKTIELLSNFEIDACFLDYFMVHATPDMPTNWNYMLTPYDAERNFDHFSQQFCFVGHSHVPCVFCQQPDGTVILSETAISFTAEKECRYIINVGSAGQPRDGIIDACYVIVDTETNFIEFCRTSYDLKRAQEKMRKAQLPEFLAARLANGK